MQHEFQALLKEQTWVLMPKLIDHSIICSKWVFRSKLYVDDTIARHKALLVALRNKQ